MSESCLLMVPYFFPPAAVAGVHRTIRFAKYMPAHGWKAAILACASASHGAPSDAGLLAKVSSETPVRYVGFRRPEDRIKEPIRRVRRLFAAHRPNSGDGHSDPAVELHGRRADFSWLDRLKEYLLWTPDQEIPWRRPAVLAARELIEKCEPRAVFGSGPPFTTHLVASDISQKFNLPLVLDFRDPWSRCPWGPRVVGAAAQRRVARMERRCVSLASRVILNTDRLRDDFRHVYPEFAAKFVTITNGFDPDLAALVEEIDGTRERVNGLPRLLHPGTLYSDRDPRPLLGAISRLKKSGNPVILEQVGPCDPAFGIADRTAQLGLRDVVNVCPAVEHQEVISRMADAELFLLIQPNNELQVPGKVFEMMLFKKPIVAVADAGATADLVRQYELGVVCPNEESSIATAIQSALGSAQRDSRVHERMLCDFDGRSLTAKLTQLLDEVCNV